MAAVAPRASVIVTTYNNPPYLEMVLAGYARQGRDDFEVVVADDGSRDETRELIDRVRAEGYLGFRLKGEGKQVELIGLNEASATIVEKYSENDRPFESLGVVGH